MKITCVLFLDFCVNFVSLCVRYVHGESIYDMFPH
jgi:hypothetical protein